jgi:hypothetical protein
MPVMSATPKRLTDSKSVIEQPDPNPGVGARLRRRQAIMWPGQKPGMLGAAGPEGEHVRRGGIPDAPAADLADEPRRRPERFPATLTAIKTRPVDDRTRDPLRQHRAMVRPSYTAASRRPN